VIKKTYIYADGGKRCRVIDYHVANPSDDQTTRTMHDRHKPSVHVLIDVGEDERQFDHEATAEELAEAFK
jgi:hypothetical protein